MIPSQFMQRTTAIGRNLSTPQVPHLPETKARSSRIARAFASQQSGGDSAAELSPHP